MNVVSEHKKHWHRNHKVFYYNGKKGINLGKKNGQWKGDNVGYTALHDYIKTYLSKPDLCENCKLKPPLDLANKSGKYLRDLSDWQWICRSCHMKKDGRMNNLIKGFQPWFKHADYKNNKNPNWKGGSSLDKKKYQREYYLKRKKL